MTDETLPDLFQPDVTDEDRMMSPPCSPAEELVGVGRRMSFSTRVMVEEDESRTSGPDSGRGAA